MDLDIPHPCLNCETCRPGGWVDGNGNPVHLGDLECDEWNLPPSRIRTTYKGLEVTLRVAIPADLEALVAQRNLFEPNEPGEPDTIPFLLREFTRSQRNSYPYVCMALVERNIVGKLFLDRNSNNAIRRNLRPAIIDSVTVLEASEGQGIAYELLSFAEEISRDNGVRWLEIGVKREPLRGNRLYKRSGTDSLRLYLKRGFHENALYLNQMIDIHYRVSGLPESATVIAPRYGKALVVYKDLESGSELNEAEQRELFEELSTNIPI